MSGFTEHTLTEILRRASVKPAVAVETGTFEGTTARLLRSVFPRVVTVEMEPRRWRRCAERHSGPPIQYQLGDSRVLLPTLSVAYDAEPVFWFLDAHWFAEEFGSRGAFGEPVADTFPLWVELSVVAHRRQPDIVVVDDRHAFGLVGTNIHVGWATVTSRALWGVLAGRIERADTIGDQWVAWLSSPVGKG